MANLDLLKSEIKSYEDNYRGPGLEPFEYGDLYDLFPTANEKIEGVGSIWPEPFPNLDKAGVYAFLSEDLEVLYIGKASMNHAIGYRLGSYCKYGENRECKLKHMWSGKPKFIYTVAVPDKTKFEAPALEEYLIGKIPTSNNKVGT